MRTNADHPTDQRHHARHPTPERVAKAKADLLSLAERDQLERELGSIVGPIIDAKLEAKAHELLERYRQSWLSAFQSLVGGSTDRSQLLVSRDEAAELLGTSLSTIKRMEERGELPEPIKYGERVVRHRLIDIETIAKTKRTIITD